MNFKYLKFKEVSLNHQKYSLGVKEKKRILRFYFNFTDSSLKFKVYSLKFKE